MEYPLGIVLVDLVGSFDLADGEALVGLLFFRFCRLFPMTDDIHQVIVDLRLRFDLLDVGKHEVVLEVALRSVDH